MYCHTWHLSYNSMWRYNCHCTQTEDVHTLDYILSHFFLVLGRCWFSFSCPGRFILDTHWTVGSVGSIFYLHGLQKRTTLALAGNRTKDPRHYNRFPGHNTHYANPAPIISKFMVGRPWLIQRKRRCMELHSVQLNTFSLPATSD
jgi:hypothetical protein